MDLNIEGESFDAVGGFVYHQHQLGKIPVGGDEVETDGLRLRAPRGTGGAAWWSS